MLTSVVLAATLALSGGRISVPSRYDGLIRGHLQVIEAHGWAVVTPGDLYHGHLLLKAGAPGRFASADALFAQSVGVLYHGDEMLIRWLGEDGGLPLSARRPRSVIVFWDGRIVPAAALIAQPDRLKDYISSGTVHLDELAAEHPDVFDVRADRAVRTQRGECLVDQIIDIGGIPLQLTMECNAPR